MKEFIEYILQFGSLNQQQIDFILRKATEIELQKNEYFLEAGNVPNRVGFILDGIIRICYYNNKGDEITKYFFEERYLIIDPRSLEHNIPYSAYQQTVTDCKLIVITKQDWNEIAATIVGWDTIIQKIFSKNLAQKIDRLSQQVSQDATTRYLTFMEKYPNLINRIPLSYIASYLGITQSSLSRIRKNLC